MNKAMDSRCWVKVRSPIARDLWHLIEARRGINHRKDAQPCRNAIQISKLFLQARQLRERHKACRCVAFVHGNFRANSADRLRNCPIEVERNVS